MTTTLNFTNIFAFVMQRNRKFLRIISKSKFVSKQLMFSFFSSFWSISFFLLTFKSSKFLFFSMSTSEIVREHSKSTFFFWNFVKFLVDCNIKKSIFWTKIVSRSIVAFKFFRFSIAIFKSMNKILKKFAICCLFVLFISFRISISKHQNVQKFYFIVNDLIRMFVKKSNSFDLQRHLIHSFFSRDFDKYNFANKYDFIQNRITLYFYAIITFVFKSIKFEIFKSIYVREIFSRQFSISSHSIAFISFFFSFFFSMRFFFDIFSFFFCLQTLLKTFCHLSIYRLNHVKRFKNWKQ